MCDCLAWHPLWSLVARDARVRPATVRFLVLYLGAAPDQPMARAAITIAEYAGRPLASVERVLLALREREVIDVDNRLTSDWSVTSSAVTVTDDVHDVVTVTGDIGDLSVTSGDLSAINQRRAVSRRSSAKYRAKLRGQCLIGEGYPPTYQLSVGDAPKEEKEEDDPLLSEKEAQARAMHPVEFIRKERWATGTMRRANDAGLLSQDAAARLWSDLMMMKPDRSMRNWGLPRRANDELDRLERLLEDREAPKLPLGSAPLLSVEGGRGPPRMRRDATPEEREAGRRVAFAKVNQRMTG